MNALNESRHDWDYWQNASFAILWDLTICPNLEVPYDCNERNRSVSLSVSDWFNKFYNTHSLGGNYFPWKYLSLSFVPIRNCLYALVCLAVCIGILCPTFLEFKQGKYTWGRATLDSYFKLFTHNVFFCKGFPSGIPSLFNMYFWAGSVENNIFTHSYFAILSLLTIINR